MPNQKTSMKLIYLLVGFVSLSSCFRNSKNLAIKNDNENHNVEENSIKEQELHAKLLKITSDSIRIADSLAALPSPINFDTVLFASILRTPCHGKCPQYEIRVFQSGLVEYQGYASVDKIGKYYCRIDSAQIKLISEMANKCGFFDLNDFYPDKGMAISDFPMCVCSVKKEDGMKIVYNRNDAPLQLIKFQNFLDQIFEELPWLSVISDK